MSAPSRIWTPERDAVVLRDYPEGVYAEVIEVRLNALPGARVQVHQIAVRAFRLGARRPDWFNPGLVGAKRKAELRKERGHLWATSGVKPKPPARTAAVPDIKWQPIPPPLAPQPVPPPVPYGGITIVSRAIKEGRTFSMLGGRAR